MTEILDIAIFDIEGDGLLDTVSKVHCIVIGCPDTGRKFRFRNNGEENTIPQALDMLRRAKMTVAHNGIEYDYPALEIVYPDFYLEGIIRDTLTLSRMCFSDIKEDDMRRWRRDKFNKAKEEDQKFPGKLIGGQGLEAWGWRLGHHKGDYSKVREAEALEIWAEAEAELEQAVRDCGELVSPYPGEDRDERARELLFEDPQGNVYAEFKGEWEEFLRHHTWGVWNQAMEDYCDNDVDVTIALWKKIQAENWDEHSVRVEHRIHDLMFRQQQAGFHFNVEKAKELVGGLRVEHEKLTEHAVKHFGVWYAPAKKHKGDPRARYGEDSSRKVWAEVTVPKKTIKYKDPKRGDRHEGVPFCPIKKKEFNPNSRQQISDRLQTIYEWEPEEFTETGQPSVNKDVLKGLSDKIPICKDLASIFYYSKHIGTIETGPTAWLKMERNGKIHHRCNVGGTVSGRASHSSPNLNVKKVKSGKRENGEKYIKLGLEGEHGFECRSLFYVPEHWGVLIGADLSGIEFRCLAEMCAEFDGGALIKVLLEDDIHTLNQEAAGLSSRDQAKKFIYVFIYGGGDPKLGSIVAPDADEETQRKLGAELRARFLKKMPALDRVIRKIKKQVRKQGYLFGLDGRKLFARSDHSALNLQLQSNGALIAKVWCLIVEQMLEEEGLEWGWDKDFVFQAWIHDEVQIAARPDCAKLVAEICEEAAVETGVYFGFQCPIAAEAQIGRNWAETH